MKIGKKLYQKRKEHNMSQDIFAGYLNISQSRLSDLENNKNARPEEVKNISTVLKIKEKDLIDEDELQFFQQIIGEKTMNTIYGDVNSIEFVEKLYKQIIQTKDDELLILKSSNSEFQEIIKELKSIIALLKK